MPQTNKNSQIIDNNNFIFYLISHMMFIPMHTKHQSLIEPRRPNHFGDDQPPPLPVKKKHSK